MRVDLDMTQITVSCAEIFSSMGFLSTWIYVQGIVLLRQLLLAKVQIVACCYLAAPINCGLLKSYILCYTAGCSMRKKMQLEKEESKFFPSCHFVKKVPPNHIRLHTIEWCGVDFCGPTSPIFSPRYYYVWCSAWHCFAQEGAAHGLCAIISPFLRIYF